MSADGLVTDAGRILRGQLLAGIPEAIGLSWYAVGDANAGWDATPPDETIQQSSLIHETARKKINRTAYLVLDEQNGTIRFNGQLYAETLTPTPILVFFTDFVESEAQGFAIREEGIFGGEVSTTAQPYALPGQVTEPGVLYWVRNRGVYYKAERDLFTGIVVLQEV